MKRWTDGRSGESGRFVGNLVLDHLDPTGTQILQHKGTVFADARHCWVGRVVADDAYLTTGVMHWANLSADQHRDMTRFGRETHRALIYLFITAHPGSHTVNFWQVPAAVIERELGRREKDTAGAVLGLHISDREGRHMLGEEDVTEYCTSVKINAASSEKITSAVRSDRNKRIRVISSDSKKDSNIVPPVRRASASSVRQFEIPLSGGRLATFNAPVPMTAQDVNRVKGFIDLMSDLLVTQDEKRKK